MANVNPMLARMAGYGGDYAITALTTPTSGLLFSHIVITEDATISDIKICDPNYDGDTGTSVKASRHYTGTLSKGYLICAGGDMAINYVKLATGAAEGIIFEV